MKAAFLVSLICLLAGLPVYLVYWNLFRPVLIQRLKYRLFKTRDDLRLLLVTGQIGDKERAYPLVEQFCNKSLKVVEIIDIVDLFWKKADKRSSIESARDLELIFNAAPAVRQCFLEVMRTAIGAACANSPGMLILFAPFVTFAFTALWFGRVANWCQELVKRAFGNLNIQPAYPIKSSSIAHS